MKQLKWMMMAIVAAFGRRFDNRAQAAQGGGGDFNFRNFRDFHDFRDFCNFRNFRRGFGALCLAAILGIGNAAFAGVVGNIPAPKTTTPERIDIVAGKSDEEREAYGRRHFGRKADGSAPIHDAAKRGDIRLVRHYLVSKENPNVQMNNGRTPLHFATKTDIVWRLVYYGANMELREEYGKTPLYFAAAFGRTNAVNELLRLGAKVDAKDRDGITPLRVAAEYGRTAIIKELLRRGADIDASDNNGRTPLRSAIEHGRLAATELLIVQGANSTVAIAATKHKNRYTPLHWAADGDGGNVSVSIAWAAHAKGKPDKVAQALIKAGAKIEAKAASNLTPLHVAALNNNAKVVSVLVEVEANLHAVASTNGGEKPIDIAKRVRARESERILRAAMDKEARQKREDERKAQERAEQERQAKIDRDHAARVKRLGLSKKEAQLDYCANVQNYPPTLCFFWSLGW